MKIFIQKLKCVVYKICKEFFFLKYNAYPLHIPVDLLQK